MVLLGGCYGVGRCCHCVATWLLGVAMLLLGFARWLLGCC